MQLEAHGLHLDAPQGWETRIFRRPAHGEAMAAAEVAGAAAPAGEKTFPIVHVATIPLPIDIADYGSEVVEELGRDDALIVVKEFDPDDVDQPLFAREGMPRSLKPGDFSTTTLQRTLAKQAGYQAFFHEGGRAFCLYVVLGNHARRNHVVPRVNAVLGTLAVDALDVVDEDDEAEEPEATTTTTAPDEDLGTPAPDEPEVPAEPELPESPPVDGDPGEPTP